MIWSGRKTSAVPVSWILCFFWLGFSSENIKNCETLLEFWRGEDQFDPSQVICLSQTSNRKRFLDPILNLESQETSIIILSIGTSVASSGHINLQHIQNHHQMNQMTVHLLGRNVKHNANALDSILMILIPLQVDRPALPKATIWKITNSRSKFTDRLGLLSIRVFEKTSDSWHEPPTSWQLAMLYCYCCETSFPHRRLSRSHWESNLKMKKQFAAPQKCIKIGLTTGPKLTLQRIAPTKMDFSKRKKRNSNDNTINMLRWKPIFGSRMLFVLVRSIAS